MRELLATKLGFAVILRGPVLANQQLRTAGGLHSSTILLNLSRSCD